MSLWKVECYLCTDKELSDELIAELRKLNEAIKIQNFENNGIFFEDISFCLEDKHAIKKNLMFKCKFIMDGCDEEAVECFVYDYFHFNWKNIDFSVGKVKCYEEE